MATIQKLTNEFEMLGTEVKQASRSAFTRESLIKGNRGPKAREL